MWDEPNKSSPGGSGCGSVSSFALPFPLTEPCGDPSVVIDMSDLMSLEEYTDEASDVEPCDGSGIAPDSPGPWSVEICPDVLSVVESSDISGHEDSLVLGPLYSKT